MSARVLLSAVALMVMLPHAFAQQNQTQLTDNDLKAAYCLGYFKVQTEILQRGCQGSQDRALTQACAEVNAEQTAKMRRVLGYLVAKGILFNAGPAGRGAMVAVAQGESDMNNCFGTNAAQAAMTCETSCVRHGRSVSDCFAACYPALCQKAPQTCESLDYLPY